MDLDISIRDVSGEDAPTVAELANDFEIAKMVATMPHPYGLQEAYDFFDKINRQREEGKGHSLLVILGGDIAGTVGWFINEEDGVEIGYWIARKFWGRGIAGEAVKLILDIIRKECPKATEVCAQYMEENPASGRVLEKNGFVPDGVVEEGCYSLARDEAKPALRMIKKL